MYVAPINDTTAPDSIPYGVSHPGHIVEGCVLASVKLPTHTYPLREALPSVYRTLR
jgi:hypothetical protein